MDASALTAKLERALLDLGDTPDTVAAYLEAQGCVARWGHLSQNCPVAVYLHRQFHCEVGVASGIALLWQSSGDGFAGRVKATPPSPVNRFIENFDAGKYPALEPRP